MAAVRESHRRDVLTMLKLNSLLNYEKDYERFVTNPYLP